MNKLYAWTKGCNKNRKLYVNYTLQLYWCQIISSTLKVRVMPFTIWVGWDCGMTADRWLSACRKEECVCQLYTIIKILSVASRHDKHMVQTETHTHALQIQRSEDERRRWHTAANPKDTIWRCSRSQWLMHAHTDCTRIQIHITTLSHNAETTNILTEFLLAQLKFTDNSLLGKTLI